MGVRILFMVLALAAAGLTAVFGWWAHANYSATPPATWSHGLLIALQLGLALCAGLGAMLFGLASLPEGDQLKDAHWCEILFREHPKKRLRAWAQSLRYFRFVRGSGGGMDDHGDCLQISLRVDASQDVAKIHTTLGIPCAHESPENRSNACWLAVAWNVNQTDDHLDISLSDHADPWAVTYAVVEAAKQIELLLEPLAHRLIDPPQDDRHCVCPKYYPSFWNHEHAAHAKQPKRKPRPFS